MRYAHILQACLDRPWALLPRKLAAIEAFLALKAAGGEVDADEVRALAAAQRSTDIRTSGVIQVIPLYGVLTQRGGLTAASEPLTSTARVGLAIRQAASDPNVRGIVLDVDSPGGEVFGTSELAAVVADAAQNAGKPVVAVANSLAASAAYWIASQAEELVVTPGGMVGSVGVYAMHVDVSRAAEMQGVNVSLISAGEHKTDGNQYEPLGDAARADIQAEVQDYYGLFVRDVARGRAVSAQTVRDTWQARMFTAKNALAAGLVDRVDTLDATIERLASGSYRKPRRAAALDAEQPETGPAPFAYRDEWPSRTSAAPSFTVTYRDGANPPLAAEPDPESDPEPEPVPAVAGAGTDLRRRRLRLLSH